MIDKIKKLLSREFILYVLFGVLTMIINTVTYAVLYNWLGWENVTSTAVAWAVSVIAAYLTNRIWVFGNKAHGFQSVLWEFSAFILCRVATGVLDIAIMHFGVDVFHFYGVLMKLFSNVIVVIGNYIASKFWIFKKK
ncbi:MAG: GtrA family protein [Clostridiales bacterium]|nr:GtrA family protein [Clostridiales bacterium]